MAERWGPIVVAGASCFDSPFVKINAASLNGWCVESSRASRKTGRPPDPVYKYRFYAFKWKPSSYTA